MISAERKREMVAELRDYLGTPTHAEFGRRIGISQQNAYTWLTRGSFDAELIKASVPEVSGDWLLTGYGEMLRLDEQMARADIERLERENERLLDQLRKNDAANERLQRQTDRLLRLLSNIALAEGKDSQNTRGENL